MKPNINNGHYDRSHSHKLSVLRLILMWTYALPKVESKKLAFFIQKTKIIHTPQSLLKASNNLTCSFFTSLL